MEAIGVSLSVRFFKYPLGQLWPLSPLELIRVRPGMYASFCAVRVQIRSGCSWFDYIFCRFISMHLAHGDMRGTRRFQAFQNKILDGLYTGSSIEGKAVSYKSY